MVNRSSRICPGCNEPFKPSRFNTRFCSANCYHTWTARDPDWHKRVSEGRTIYKLSDEQLLGLYQDKAQTIIPHATLYQMMRKRKLPINRPQANYTIKTLSPEGRAWLACALDSEGCLRISHTNGYAYPDMQIANTNQEYIQNIVALTGIPTVSTRKPQKPGWKEQYVWQIRQRAAVRNILTQIHSHLIIKRDTAEDILNAS